MYLQIIVKFTEAFSSTEKATVSFLLLQALGVFSHANYLIWLQSRLISFFSLFNIYNLIIVNT